VTVQVKSFVRAYNRYQILNTIRRAGLISRIDISKLTGLSQASITGITADLINEGLIVEEKTGSYKGGRRPILLAINPDGAYVIGVNVELRKINVVIINLQAEQKSHYSLSMKEKKYSPEELAQKITEAVLTCIWESGFSKNQISGIGVGLPGLVDSEVGIVRYSPDLEWRDVHFRDILKKRINHNVFIDNNANNLTLAEHWFGQGNTSDNFILIVIDYGVGAGCIVNGQLLRGHFGLAGEFGHIALDDNGPLCGCGARGCLGSYLGIGPILKEVENLAKNGLWKSGIKDNLTFNDVIKELKSGNTDLENVYKKAGEVLGIGVSHLIKIFDPEKIIITGEGVLAGNFLFDPMYESLHKKMSGNLPDYQAEIVIKNWSQEAWAKGAGTLALQEIYKSPALR